MEKIKHVFKMISGAVILIFGVLCLYISLIANWGALLSAAICLAGLWLLLSDTRAYQNAKKKINEAIDQHYDPLRKKTDIEYRKDLKREREKAEKEEEKEITSSPDFTFLLDIVLFGGVFITGFFRELVKDRDKHK